MQLHLTKRNMLWFSFLKLFHRLVFFKILLSVKSIISKINSQLNIFPEIDSEWLWPRSIYSPETLVNYIADHIDEIPQANPPDAASASTHSNHLVNPVQSVQQPSHLSACLVYPPCDDTDPNLAAAIAACLNQSSVSSAADAASLPADPLNTSTEERAHYSIINALNRSAVIRHNDRNEDHDNKVKKSNLLKYQIQKNVFWLKLSFF